jgi:AraC-like DNA-binding protein
MCLHPVHISNVVKLHTGHHACYFYERRILEEAKKLLADPSLSIKNIAHKLDYDVSNFTKFFKRFTGETPSSYRKSL